MATYDSVLEVLTLAPLTAKEVEGRLKEAGHSAKAVPTTLSELKAKGKVTYDTPGGPWRILDEKGSVVVPEGTTLVDAMLAEIAKKPLTLDELRGMFGKSAKATLQTLARQRKVTNAGRGEPWHATNGHGKATKATKATKAAKATNHAPTGLQAKLLATLAKQPRTHKQLVARFQRDVSVPLARLKSQGKVTNDGPGTPWRLTGTRKVKGGPAEDDDAVDTLKPLKVTERKVKRSEASPTSSPTARSQRLIDKAFRTSADPFINDAIKRRAAYIKKIAVLDAVILSETEDE